MALIRTVAQAIRDEPRPSGFDYMRFVLAFLVVFSHVLNISFGQHAADRFVSTPFRPLQTFILPMFFCLSGFLVSGSLARSRTSISFFGLRIIRLFPALAVESILAALFLGPIFTTLPLAEYLAHPLFRSYFWNMLGDPQYYLPGVFQSLPLPVVNGQLWALPWELTCYGSLAALALLRLLRDRRSILRVAVILTFALAVAGWAGHAPDRPFLARVALLECFLFGALAFFYGDRIPLRRRWFAASSLLACLLFLSPYGDYFIAAPMAYATIYLGLMNPRQNRLISSGDYSYGIYLYGFPIQQAVTAVIGPSPWYLDLAVAVPFILAASVLSWWCVEKPAQKLRRCLTKVEDLWLNSRLNPMPTHDNAVPGMEHRHQAILSLPA